MLEILKIPKAGSAYWDDFVINDFIGSAVKYLVMLIKIMKFIKEGTKDGRKLP